MGEWHKVEFYSPCNACSTGSCDVSSEIRDGEVWTKIDACHETCDKLLHHNLPVKGG